MFNCEPHTFIQGSEPFHIWPFVPRMNLQTPPLSSWFAEKNIFQFPNMQCEHTGRFEIRRRDGHQHNFRSSWTHFELKTGTFLQKQKSLEKLSRHPYPQPHPYPSLSSMPLVVSSGSGLSVAQQATTSSSRSEAKVLCALRATYRTEYIEYNTQHRIE